MQTWEFISKRQSCREYKNKEISKTDRENFLEYSKIIEENYSSSIGLRWVEDGESFASNLGDAAGYQGKMIKAPHYMVILSKDDRESIATAGYIGEKIALKAFSYSIANCWITVNKPKVVKENLVGIRADKEPIAILALGYAKTENFIQKFFGKAKVATADYREDGYKNVDFQDREKDIDRSHTNDYIYSRKWNNVINPEELEVLGYKKAFSMMKYAPSYENKQPWRFIILDDSVLVCIEKDEKEVNTALQAGIMMNYIEMGMNRIGIEGKFLFEDLKEEDYGVPNSFEIIATYKIAGAQ